MLWSQLYLQLKHHELKKLKKYFFLSSFFPFFISFPSLSELQSRGSHTAKPNLAMEEWLKFFGQLSSVAL